jgi:hypothetical protein
MWFKNFVIGICGRGIGKTFLLGTLSVLSCMLFPGYKVGLIAPVFRQSIISGGYDTFWTDGGLKTTAEEFYNSIQPGITQTQSLKFRNTILSKWQNPDRACRHIRTTKGFELAGTVDHGILVLDNELNLVFKELQNITDKDNIVIRKAFNYFGNDLDIGGFKFTFGTLATAKPIIVPKTMTEDLSYLLGLLCGDGFISSDNIKNNNFLIGYCSADESLIRRYLEIIKQVFGITINNNRIKLYGKTSRVEISSVMLRHFLKYLGMSSETASEKKFPVAIKKSNKENIVSFIRGLYDTDGCCYVTTKGHLKSCLIEYVSVSKQLCKELQAMLLNFGIISSFGVKQKAYKKFFPGRIKESTCKICYRLRITGTDNLTMFSKYIGFGLKRKQDKLNNYLDSLTKIDFNNTISNTFDSVRRLAFACNDKNSDKEFLYHYISQWKKDRKTDFCKSKIIELLEFSETNGVFTEDYYKLKKIMDLDLSFVKMKESRYFFAPTIDVEVENESCYWSSGFISHNSKMIFSEVEKLYAQSSVFKEACEKRPIRGTDTCYVEFKSVGGIPPAKIESLPLSDGSKIRGSRFYLVCLDELAQIPSQIIDAVLRPMGSATLNPMINVHRIEKQRKLIELGLADQEDFDDTPVNKMIMTSSGYYKFNHMWKRMKDHWSQMDIAEKKGVESQYSVWQIPYWDLPEGFLDSNNIAEAKRIMSSSEFKMEYEAEMISDSEGFFKASLLEECTNNSGFSIELRGKAADQYIIGIDPNQGGNASCGILIIKIGAVKHVVSALELKRLTTQDSTKTVQKLCDDYNIVRIFMDSRGGGNALRDLLEEGYGGVEPIIDRTNSEHKHIEGRHILEMVDFNPKWIANANFTTKALLEDKKLLFPEPPQTISDLEGKLYENINTLKSQMLNIVVTQTGVGNLHFDTPRKGQNKDLYSAMILAAHGAREFEKEFEEEVIVLYNSGGLVRERKPGATFNPIVREGPALSKVGIEAAILKGKRRIK